MLRTADKPRSASNGEPRRVRFCGEVEVREFGRLEELREEDTIEEEEENEYDSIEETVPLKDSSDCEDECESNTRIIYSDILFLSSLLGGVLAVLGTTLYLVLL